MLRVKILISRCRNLSTFHKFKPLDPALPVMVAPSGGEWPLIHNNIETLRNEVIAVQRQYDEKSWNDLFRFRLGYTSNKIEGNNFTESEVLQFFKTGVTVGGKTIREHMEIESHDHALQFVIDSVQLPVNEVASVDYICNLHKICMPAPRVYLKDDPIPGQLKTENNHVISIYNGERNVRSFVHSDDVHRQLTELCAWCAEHEGKMPILAFITIFHYNFVRIHPFADTNGRTVRLLTALYMLRQGYPPVIIEPTQRQEYMAALTHADFEEDLAPLMKFLAKSISSTYNDLLQL